MAGLGLAVLGVVLLASSLSSAAEASLDLGTAGSFAVLAGTGVTNTGPTVVDGDVGTCPTPAITGFPPGTVNGTTHAADAECLQAQSDLTVAYNAAAGRSPTITYPGVKDLGGETLTAGVYRADALGITGTLTLDGEGDPNAVFIFQAGSTLITQPNSEVSLINEAQACNVFWQVGSSATLGVGSTFVGSVLALASITVNTNAFVEGRVLARNGAVTLDSNVVSVPACVPPPTTAPDTTASPTIAPPTTAPDTTAPDTTAPDTTAPDTTAPDTTDTTAPDTTDTTAPDTTAPPTTAPDTTAPGTTAPGTTAPASAAPATTAPGSAAPASAAPATTAPGSAAPASASATTTSPKVLGATSGGGPGGPGGGTEALAFAGSSVRRTQVWAGLALTLGGLLVFFARDGEPLHPE